MVKTDKSRLLNMRSEVFPMCVHQRRFVARRFKRTQARSRNQSNQRVETTKGDR